MLSAETRRGRRVNGLQVQEVPIALRRREQRREEYRALNPLAKARARRALRGPNEPRARLIRRVLTPRSRAQVPALQEDGWVLPESCAILRYLCNSRRSVPDHWRVPLRRPRWRARRECHVSACAAPHSTASRAHAARV